MAKFKEMSKPKKAWRIIWIILVAIVGAFLVYAGIVFATFHRIPDWEKLETTTATNPTSQNTQKVSTNAEYKALSYNTGFGAYTQNFTFFMDGGVQSWADSPNSVVNDFLEIGNMLKNENPDFISLQEVDNNSTRTYHIDETNIVNKMMSDYNSVSACCYDSPWLPWPPYQPHGMSFSNLMTLSRYMPSNPIRRQFPIDEGLTKILDYDRSYSKMYYECDNGKKLVYYTTHMSAYAKDPSTSNKQIQQIVDDMQSEYAQGNYCICGADFNKQIVDNPQNYFDSSVVKDTKPFPVEFLEDTGVELYAPFNVQNPVGTCRDAGVKYSENSQISNIDGFLITKNVEPTSGDVVDTKFEYSDHNPVWMRFKLKN